MFLLLFTAHPSIAVMFYKRGVKAQWLKVTPGREEKNEASISGSLALEPDSDHLTQREMAAFVLPKLRDLPGLVKPI